MNPRVPIVTFVLAATIFVLGCDDDDHHGGPTGLPTQSVCPTTQTLTYANFGQTFFESYCQGCHASTVTGAARKGAPADHVFDQVEDIRLLTDHIDELAAAGPAGVNTVMPPEDPRPSQAERQQLGEWLACGAP